MLNFLPGAAFSRNFLSKKMLPCKGTRRVVSGPTCAYPRGFCNLQGLCFHSNSQAESWSSWRKEAGLQPILPIRASLAVFKASSTAASLGLANTRRLAKTCTLPWDCHGQVGWYGEAGLWLEKRRSPLHCRRPPSSTALFQAQLQAVWPSLTL